GRLVLLARRGHRDAGLVAGVFLSTAMSTHVSLRSSFWWGWKGPGAGRGVDPGFPADSLSAVGRRPVDSLRARGGSGRRRAGGAGAGLGTRRARAADRVAGGVGDEGGHEPGEEPMAADAAGTAPRRV